MVRKRGYTTLLAVAVLASVLLPGNALASDPSQLSAYNQYVPVVPGAGGPTLPSKHSQSPSNLSAGSGATLNGVPVSVRAVLRQVAAVEGLPVGEKGSSATS